MFLVLLISFCQAFVLSIDGVEFDKQDFYSKYSMSEWNASSDKQKTSLLNDYVKRESAAIEASSLGFDLDPLVLSRFLDIEKQLLVNFFYDNSVARPLVSSDDLFLTEKNLKKEVEVKHLLVSHNESALQQKNERNKSVAVELINEIRLLINKDISLFDSLVIIYSDDPGAARNLGNLGWLEWGRTPMPFQSSVWGLSPGGFSAPIETQYGYHLATVVNSRNSQFFYYDTSSYNYEATRRALSLIRDQLPAAALSYENKVFKEISTIHGPGFEELFSLMSQELLTLSKGERFDFVGFLKNVENKLILFSLGENYFGVRFFINDILKQNPSKVPSFNTKEELVSYFKLLFLRHVIELEAREQGLASRVFFKKRLAIEKSRFLYDFYLKSLVNSVDIPDSTAIQQYYLENKDSKYFVPEKVVVRQIRLKNKNIADSLFSIISVDNFQTLASSFSINRRELGGLMAAFERGKFNNLGEAAFSLEKGEISNVLENLDKTFSIILLEEKIGKESLPLSRVYKRIESLLLKEGQENIKKTTFDNYLNNENIKLGGDYEIYFN